MERRIEKRRRVQEDWREKKRDEEVKEMDEMNEDVNIP